MLTLAIKPCKEHRKKPITSSPLSSVLSHLAFPSLLLSLIIDQWLAMDGNGQMVGLIAIDKMIIAARYCQLKSQLDI
jgi:hypothetical protein